MISLFCLLVFFLASGEEGREKMYYGIFGLSNEDRVIDYKNASFEKKYYSN